MKFIHFIQPTHILAMEEIHYGYGFHDFIHSTAGCDFGCKVRRNGSLSGLSTFPSSYYFLASRGF
jgi:hypothetical protein